MRTTQLVISESRWATGSRTPVRHKTLLNTAFSKVSGKRQKTFCLLYTYIHIFSFYLPIFFSEAHFTDIYAEVRFSEVHTLIADKMRSFCRPPHQEVSGSLFLSFCTRILLLWGQILEVQKGAPTARTEPALPAAGQSRSATRR